MQWSSTQGAHGRTARSPTSYGLDPEQVQVITPDVGGGFGAKIGGYPEEVLLAWLASRSAGRCGGSRPAPRT